MTADGDLPSGLAGDATRWPLDWRALSAADRRPWFEALWDQVCDLRGRYRLAVRSRWWEDSIQVEALAAVTSWVARYDEGEWDDPPGKLALLFELERIQTLLRGGHEPLDPDRDRAAFDRFVDALTDDTATPVAPTGDVG